MDYRIEKDTMGEVKVPANALYGAQTQRSIENFRIAQDINKMPIEIIRAFAYLKKAAAITNFEAGVLTREKIDMISKVCDEILGCTRPHFMKQLEGNKNEYTSVGRQRRIKIKDVLINKEQKKKKQKQH